MKYTSWILYASALVILLTVALPSYNRLWLDLNISSMHGDEDYNTRACPTCEKEVHEYNNVNPGLGLSYGVNNYFDLSVGGYYNSFDNLSFYSGGTIKYPIRLGGKWIYEPGIFGGAATGYTDTPKDTNGHVYGGFLPYGGISNTLVYENFRGTIGFVPDITNNNDVPYSILTFQLGYNF